MALKRLTDKQIKRAIEKSYGNVTAAADSLGYDPSTVRRRVNSSKSLQKTLKEAREQIVDIAESKRLELIHAGDWKAIEHALRTWGKHRGHNIQHEITGPDGEALLKEHLNPSILSALYAQGHDAESILISFLKAANIEYDNIDANLAEKNS